MKHIKETNVLEQIEIQDEIFNWLEESLYTCPVEYKYFYRDLTMDDYWDSMVCPLCEAKEEIEYGISVHGKEYIVMDDEDKYALNEMFVRARNKNWNINFLGDIRDKVNDLVEECIVSEEFGFTMGYVRPIWASVEKDQIVLSLGAICNKYDTFTSSACVGKLELSTAESDEDDEDANYEDLAYFEAERYKDNLKDDDYFWDNLFEHIEEWVKTRKN